MHRRVPSSPRTASARTRLGKELLSDEVDADAVEYISSRMTSSRIRYNRHVFKKYLSVFARRSNRLHSSRRLKICTSACRNFLSISLFYVRTPRSSYDPVIGIHCYLAVGTYSATPRVRGPKNNLILEESTGVKGCSP